MEHYAQVGITGRFQDFVKDFSAENSEGTLLSGLSSITKVPVQLVTGSIDEVCPIDDVKRLQTELGDACQLFTEIPDVGHSYFATETATDAFKTMLKTHIEYVKPEPIEDKTASGAYGLTMAGIAAFIGMMA